MGGYIQGAYVIVAVVSTLIFCAFSFTFMGRALVKFLHQMTNSVARSKPFQGNKKYKNCVQFDASNKIKVILLYNESMPLFRSFFHIYIA